MSQIRRDSLTRIDLSRRALMSSIRLSMLPFSGLCWMDMVDYKLDRQIERMSNTSLREIADRILQAGVEDEIIKMLTGEE